MEQLIDLTDFLIISISKKEIESKKVNQIIGMLNRLLENKETIIYFRERVDIVVTGYDNDSRELWEIPEVRNYIVELDSQFP